MTCLLNNSQEPFNILYCDDVYFDTYTEKQLTEKLIENCKEFVKMKLEEYKTAKTNFGECENIIQTFKYLNRFFIGGGRICSFFSDIKVPMSIPKVSKNVHYNIEVNIFFKFFF